jgi:histone demethylase JARID1
MKHSTLSLLEVLSPRTDIGNTNNYRTKKRKVRDADVDYSVDVSAVMRILSDIRIDFMPDLPTLVSAFQSDTSNEVEAMVALRTFNLSKLTDTVTEKFCMCRQSRSANMLQCELCKDLFHAECISSGKSSFKSSSSAIFSEKFLCPLCVRSRRPRLETVLSLLLALQKLPVRIPAGELLQLLAERTMSWQDRARRFLSMDEVTIALARVGEHPDGIDHMTTTDEGQHRLASGLWQDTGKHTFDTEFVAPFEHAYSSVSKHNSSAPTQPAVIHRKLSCTTAADMLLPPHLYAHLERLILEGDLLEVTVDETQQLWKLWKSCHRNSSDLTTPWIPGLKEESLTATVDTAEEQRKKRRKHLEVRSGDSRMELFVAPNKLKSDPYAKDYGKLQQCGSKNDWKKTKLMMKKGLRKQPSQSVDEDVSLSENNDEDCSAVKCLKPSGQEVDWVQCDGCQLWFHLVCIGLNKQDVSSDKEYVCQMCRNHQLSSQPYDLHESVVRLSSGYTLDVMAHKSQCRVQPSVCDITHEQLPGVNSVPLGIGVVCLSSHIEFEANIITAMASHDQVMHENPEVRDNLDFVASETVFTGDQVVSFDNGSEEYSKLVDASQDSSQPQSLPHPSK